eukprot:9035429-Pyramimonas_sp.AAC.1
MTGLGVNGPGPFGHAAVFLVFFRSSSLSVGSPSLPRRVRPSPSPPAFARGPTVPCLAFFMVPIVGLPRAK